MLAEGETFFRGGWSVLAEGETFSRGGGNLPAEGEKRSRGCRKALVDPVVSGSTGRYLPPADRRGVVIYLREARGGICVRVGARPLWRTTDPLEHRPYAAPTPGSSDSRERRVRESTEFDQLIHRLPQLGSQT